MIRVIIFDGDHTLYFPHTSKAYDRKFSFLERKTGISRSEIRKVWEGIVDEVKGDPNPEKRTREYSTKKTLEKLHVDNPDLLAEKAVDVFWTSVKDNLQVRDDAEALLNDLREKYTLVIASDEFEKRLVGKLNSFLQDWKKYFDFMVTPEKTKSMKPSERYYEIALKKLDVQPSEMVMIGDSWERDLEPAKKLGIKTVLISEQKEGDPDYLIQDLKDLKSILGDSDG